MPLRRRVVHGCTNLSDISARVLPRNGKLSLTHIAHISIQIELRRLERVSAVNSACPLKKDYNTVVPIRRAMFCHLNKTIFLKLFKGVLAMFQRLLWQRYNAAKRPLKLSFSKIT